MCEPWCNNVYTKRDTSKRERIKGIAHSVADVTCGVTYWSLICVTIYATIMLQSVTGKHQ